MIIFNKRDRTKHAYIQGLTAIALSLLALWYFYFSNSVESVSPGQQNNQYTQLRAADRLQTVKGLPPCDSASISPFALSLSCDPTLRSAQSEGENAERTLMIRKAIAGDTSQYETYFEYSYDCRFEAAKISRENPHCDPRTLAGNDAQVLRMAEHLAKAGNTQAQVTAAKLWYAEALSPALRERAIDEPEQPRGRLSPITLPFGTGQYTGVAQSLPGNQPWFPEGQSPAVTTAVLKASYYFVKAGPENMEAQGALYHFASFGIPYIDDEAKIYSAILEAVPEAVPEAVGQPAN